MGTLSTSKQINGLFACLLLTLLALYPMFTHRGLPQGSDVDVHYWRTFEFDYLWARGELVPRWAEHFYYGYGSPAFLYTASDFYALAVMVGKLPFVDDVWRIKLVWCAGVFLACYGMYRFGARRWGATGGLVSAAALIFSPPLIFSEPIGRASFPVVLGMGCFAMSLALLDETARTRRSGLWAALCLFGLLWSHNLTAIMGAAVLSSWLAWQAIFNRREFPFIKEAGMVLGLGGGLSAFFWLPVLLERHLVTVGRMPRNEDLNFRTHFQSISQLIKPASLYDANLFVQQDRFSLGVVGLLLAGIGLLALGIYIYQRREYSARFKEMIYWSLLAGLMTFLVVPQSRSLWENIPHMDIFLLPTRFLNFAAVGLALLAGCGVHWITSTGWRQGWLVALLLLIAQGLQATPWSWQNFPAHASAKAYLDYELASGTLGTTSANEFLPPTVRIPPPPTGFLLDSLAAGEPSQRLNAAVYPQGTQLHALESSPTHYRFAVDTPNPLSLEVYLTYFEGWRGKLDGRTALEIAPSGDYGFMRMEVPAGSHTIDLSYPLTSIERSGWLLSGLSLVLLLGWWYWLPRRPSIKADQIEALSGIQVLQVGGVVLIGVIGSLLFMREGIAWRASPVGEAQTAGHAFNADFGGDVQLLGYDVARQPHYWRLSLYWYFDLPAALNTNSFVHVVNEEGQVVAQLDKVGVSAITGAPYWKPDYHLRDVYLLKLPSALPAGDYRLRLGLWRCRDAAQSVCPDDQHVPLEVDGQPFIYLPETLHE